MRKEQKAEILRKDTPITKGRGDEEKNVNYEENQDKSKLQNINNLIQIFEKGARGKILNSENLTSTGVGIIIDLQDSTNKEATGNLARKEN